jgi:dTDP-4-amino-4,6-dideoxygalactose transaminase
VSRLKRLAFSHRIRQERVRSSSAILQEPLAILGGPKAVPSPDPDLFKWPSVTAEDEHAILDVVRAGNMSGTDITRQVEKEWSAYQGVRYSLGHCSGTASLQSCMFGGGSGRGCNFPLHLHPVLNEADVYGDGKRTRIAFAARDVRQLAGSLPVTERLSSRCLGIPWFKHDRSQAIARYAAAFRKVAMNARSLLSTAAAQ